MGNRILLPTLAAVTAALCVLSLAVGPSPIDLVAAVKQLILGLTSTEAAIIGQIRLPRTLLAVATGASLGLAGAAMQGWVRNPLAEPGLLGVSASAALGAVIVFYGGWTLYHPLALPLGGIAGALVSVLFLYALAGRAATAHTLILAGVAVNSIAGALTSLTLSLSPNPFALSEIVFWLLGSLADRTTEHVLLMAPFVAVGTAMLLSAGKGLEALSLGEETAFTLGFSPTRVGVTVAAGTALAVGASVAVIGAVGFVGLVVPHVLRPLVGHSARRLLPAAAFGGAALVLAADCTVRLMAPGPELKLGVVTALIGAPFMLALVLRLRHAGMR